MLEVEAKIPISKSELENLKERLTKEAKLLGNKISADTYYEKSEHVFIRVRQNGAKHTFTIKRRETISGIESNLEMEWGIKDIRKWRNLLARLKIAPFIRKFKKGSVFRLKGFNVELNYVRQLGHFLEIERLVSHADETSKAKNELVELFRELGYTPKQFEPKPYLQLLENV